jgi:hypothetical protein
MKTASIFGAIGLPSVGLLSQGGEKALMALAVVVVLLTLVAVALVLATCWLVSRDIAPSVDWGTLKVRFDRISEGGSPGGPPAR